MASMLTVDPHPLVEIAAIATTFPAPLGEIPTPDALRGLLSQGPEALCRAPLRSDEAVRAAVRDLLRHGGYKPTGRGKPSSEYLVRAVSEGALGSINVAVDTCNVVSLHSGLPISVVDLDRARPPLRVGVAKPGEKYVFNASGQEIDLGGLLCLFDADGPSANGVKDAQRTKTHPGTQRTLSILWGTRALPGRAREAAAWYRSLLEGARATTEDVTPA
jgi:DNA/RNA-binding domain of Phe-tRNA-synthetase-like protein